MISELSHENEVPDTYRMKSLMMIRGIWLRRLRNKFLILIVVFTCALILYGYLINTSRLHPGYSELDQREVNAQKLHLINVENFYKKREGLLRRSSKLGRILFLGEKIPYPNPNQNKTFNILVWKYWNWLKRRHVYNFGSSGHNESNLLQDCSVQNCIFSGEDDLINTADAVVVHIQRGQIPEVQNRTRKQRWIFLNDETPIHAFSLSKGRQDWKALKNIFNWSMTYRSDADVPVPYGRIVPLERARIVNIDVRGVAALVPHWEKKIRDVPATVLMSNCGVKERNNFLKNLTQYLKVDVYGKCSTIAENRNSCPGHFTSDCEVIDKYLFYLVLENSKCYQYLTEKVFYHAYTKGAIPIIWGPSFSDVQTLLPPDSFIYADRDTDIEKIAKTVSAIADNDDLLLSLHKWRNDFEVINEHGYFRSRSVHFCRICEAMNYNDDTEKVYDEKNLKYFLDPDFSCIR